MRVRNGWIAAAFTLSTFQAEACSCSGGNPGSCEVPVADIIVPATVVSKDFDQPRPPFAPPASRGTGQRAAASRPPGAIPQPRPWGGVKVTLSVSEPFRGAVAGTLAIRTEAGEEACGYPFEVGQEYLVFANGNQEN